MSGRIFSSFEFHTLLLACIDQSVLSMESTIITINRQYTLALIGTSIQSGGLNAISSFIRMPTTPNDTLRLLLRTLAILCRLPKGALKLLSVSYMPLHATYPLICLFR